MLFNKLSELEDYLTEKYHKVYSNLNYYKSFDMEGKAHYYEQISNYKEDTLSLEEIPSNPLISATFNYLGLCRCLKN